MANQVNLDGTRPPGGGGGGVGGGGGGGGGGSPIHGLAGSPGLITSTGGLTGFTGALYAPFIDTKLNALYFAVFDPSNFDTEEDAFYFFPQPDAPNGVGRKVSIHKIILVYREIGKASFNIGVQAYLEEEDKFISVTKTVNINRTDSKDQFPDFKLHTRKISIGPISGERPEPFIQRLANKGPFSIVKLVMCGKAEEKDQV